MAIFSNEAVFDAGTLARQKVQFGEDFDPSRLVPADEPVQFDPSRLVPADEPDKAVYDEASGKTISVPAGLNEIELDFKILTDVHKRLKSDFFGMTDLSQMSQEDVFNTATSRISSAVAGAADVITGAASDIAASNIPADLAKGVALIGNKVGMALTTSPMEIMSDKMLNRRKQIEAGQEDFTDRLGLAFRAQNAVFDFAATRPGFAEMLGEASKDMVNKNNKFLKETGLAGNADDGLAVDIGMGLGSVGISVALTLITKNPLYAAALFGAFQKTDLYNQMKTAGFSQEKRDVWSTFGGIFEGGVEALGGKILLNAVKYSKPLQRMVNSSASQILKINSATLKNVLPTVIKIAGEVGQETTQQLGEEVITQATGAREVDILAGVKRVLYAGMVGALVGAPVHTTIDYVGSLGKKEDLPEDVINGIKEKVKDMESEAHQMLADTLRYEGSQLTSDPDIEKMVKEVVQKFMTGEPIEMPTGFSPQHEAVVWAIQSGIEEAANTVKQEADAAEDAAMADAKSIVPPDVLEHFEISEIERAIRESKDSYTRESLVYMSPDEFLGMAEEMLSPRKPDAAAALKSGAKFKDRLPFLSYEHDGAGTATVKGHEGRHRALALKGAGVKLMPVRIRSIGGEGGEIRPNRRLKDAYQRDKVWPKELRGEGSRGNAMPFPVSDPLLKQQPPGLEPLADAAPSTPAPVLNSPWAASANANMPRRIVDGREYTDFAETNKPSFRRQLFEAMGLDPAQAVNMAPNELIERAKPLFRSKYNIEIEAGNKTQAIHVLDNLTDAWITFQFFSQVLGIPDFAIGLKGMKVTINGKTSHNTMKLLFSKNGQANLGSYSPATNTIEIAGRSNSFAHEWGHALDFMVLDVMGVTEDSLGHFFSGYTSRIRRAGVSYEPNSVSEAWIDLMNAMFFDDAFKAAKILELEQKYARTDSAELRAEIKSQIEKVKSGNYRGYDHSSYYRRSAMGVDKATGRVYFSKPTEMLARAFEAYIAMKIEVVGASNDMLSKTSDAYLNSSAEFTFRFPQAEERIRIFMAIEKMLQKLREAAILENGNLDPSTNPDMNTLDPSRWNRIQEEDMPRGMVAKLRKYFSREERLARKIAEEDVRVRKLTLEKDPQGFWTHLDTWTRNIYDSHQGFMRMILARNPSSPKLKKLVSYLSTDAGSGKKQEKYTYQETMRLIEDSYSSKLDKIVTSFKVRVNNKDEIDATNEILQGLPRTKILSPQREAALTEAMARFREDIYKSIFYEVETALNAVGKSIGYVRDAGYMPQIFDHAYIFNNHEDSINRLTEAYAITLRKAYNGKNGLQEILEDANKYIPRSPNTAALEAAIKSGVDAATIQQIANDLAAEVISYLTPIQAQALYERIIHGAEHIFEGETGNGLTKSRSFPAETLAVLQPLRINNPVEATKIYISGAARVVAWSRTFGTAEKLEEDLRWAQVHEGAHPEDVKLLRQSILELTGRDANYDITAGAREVGNNFLTFSVLNLMGRSIFPSVPEPLVAAIKSGDLRTGLLAMIGTFKAVIDTNSAHDLRAELEYHGVVTSKGADRNADDFYGTRHGYQKSSAMAAGFYENALIGPYTRKSRIGTSEAFMLFIKRLAKTITDTGAKDIHRQRAIAELYDNGIQEPEKFAEYVISLGDKLYPLRSDESPLAAEFWKATKNFSEKTIQRPSLLTKPRAAGQTRYPMVYTLQGFNYAFHENVRKAIPRWYQAEVARLKNLGHSHARAEAIANTALRYLPSYATYFLGATSAFLLRTLLTNWDNFDDKTDEEKITYILKGGFLYTLPFGPTGDIVMNIAQGIKYKRDFTTLTAGAGVGNLLSLLQNAVTSVVVENSKKTNTSERARVKALYELVIQPAATFATSKLSGAAGAAMGIANMFIGSQDAKNRFTTALAGKKKDTKKKHKY